MIDIDVRATSVPVNDWANNIDPSPITAVNYIDTLVYHLGHETVPQILDRATFNPVIFSTVYEAAIPLLGNAFILPRLWKNH